MTWTTTEAGAAMVAAAIATGAIVFLVKHGDIKDLREENQALTTAKAELTSERDEVRAALAEAETSNLSEKERIELMKLRGEVTQLRQGQAELQTLRQHNRALQERLAEASEAAFEAEPAGDPANPIIVQRLNDAKYAVLAVRMYANDNGGQLPPSLVTTSNYWDDPEALGRLLANGVELVAQGPFSAISDPSETILVRERQATLIDGKPVKAYGFADGHSQVLARPPEGFEAWESTRIMPRQ